MTQTILGHSETGFSSLPSLLLPAVLDICHPFDRPVSEATSPIWGITHPPRSWSDYTLPVILDHHIFSVILWATLDSLNSLFISNQSQFWLLLQLRNLASSYSGINPSAVSASNSLSFSRPIISYTLLVMTSCYNCLLIFPRLLAPWGRGWKPSRSLQYLYHGTECLVHSRPSAYATWMNKQANLTTQAGTRTTRVVSLGESVNLPAFW